jgi:type I restriction enzyme M protein
VGLGSPHEPALHVEIESITAADLDDFVACYHPENRTERIETWPAENPDGRWRSFTYQELIARDIVSLNLSWVRDQSLDDGADLNYPDVIAQEIIEDLKAALDEFALIQADLAPKAVV